MDEISLAERRDGFQNMTYDIPRISQVIPARLPWIKISVIRHLGEGEQGFSTLDIWCFCLIKVIVILLARMLSLKNQQEKRSRLLQRGGLRIAPWLQDGRTAKLEGCSKVFIDFGNSGPDITMSVVVQCRVLSIEVALW